MIPPERDCFSGLSQPFSSLTGPARAAVLSLCLGIVLTLHLTELLHVVLGYDALLPVDWSLYVVSLCVFHLSEYFLVAQYNPQDLSSSAFILNDNASYQLAQLFCWAEYWVEAIAFPAMKSITFSVWGIVFWLGMAGMIVGQTLRIAARCTAGYAFTHLVKAEKREGHRLITHGIYQYLRHPGYFGWYLWSLGICVLLRTPISLLVFAYAAFKFFKTRIAVEEEQLENMFGDEYTSYKKRTPVGIPGIQ
eukprot:gb/GECG01001307.1/.p1 GENE.gb/GECG01001307.1/~~gb/GECG01001307.1/.p1  ORF type:complete len:249 (+),score=16.79 gb/GECG01001307.1/:1-747(+)